MKRDLIRLIQESVKESLYSTYLRPTWDRQGYERDLRGERDNAQSEMFYSEIMFDRINSQDLKGSIKGGLIHALLVAGSYLLEPKISGYLPIALLQGIFITIPLITNHRSAIYEKKRLKENIELSNQGDKVLGSLVKDEKK